MTIGEKVSYIKGLVAGMNTEDKVIAAILDVLGDIADNLAEVDEELDDVADVMTDLEESVCDLEDEIYGSPEEEQPDYDDDLGEELDKLYETTCPNCGNTIRFDYEQASRGGFDCPNCGKRLAFELEDDESEEL